MSLLEQIQRGESKTLEFKQQLPKHGQIAQTAIAFANIPVVNENSVKLHYPPIR